MLSTNTTFCARLTPEEFAEQSRLATEKALAELQLLQAHNQVVSTPKKRSIFGFSSRMAF